MSTAGGKGRIVGHEILAQKVVVEFDDRRRVILGVQDLTHVEPPPRGRGSGSGHASRGAAGAGPTAVDLDDLLEDDDPTDL